MNLSLLSQKAYENRVAVLEAVRRVGKGHIGGTFSCIELLTVLYYEIMRYDVNQIDDPCRDRLLVGKGHACLGVYNILADIGFIDVRQIDEYGMDGSLLGGQLDVRVPGVEISTGSLGHALGIGCGLALASKIDNRSYKTYVLLGDGECDEGSVWESALFAVENNLAGLVLIVDRNRLSVTEHKPVSSEICSLEKRFAGFGWELRVVDGHNMSDIKEVLSCEYTKPLVLIADTIKGKGVPFMESKLKWHHSIPTSCEFDRAIQYLKDGFCENA